jgi:hypothetical protein
MKKKITTLFILSILFLSKSKSFAQTVGVPCADLFFSEYVDPGPGHAGCKLLEIYNPTATVINLAGYKVKQVSNGICAATNPVFTFPAINLNAGDVYVINGSTGNMTSIDSSFVIPNRDTVWGIMNFNGNDALLLMAPNNDTLDIFGIPCYSPNVMTCWVFGSDSTKDRTLVRNPNIHNGSSNWANAVNEWTGYAVNTLSNIGSHNMTSCSAGTITASICQGSSYTVGTSNYSSTGTFVTHLTNAVGSDSSVTLNLTVKANSTKTLTASICQGSSYTVGTSSYNTTGTFVTHLTNAVGCDSAVTLHLIIKPTSTKTINSSICQGASYTIGTSTYTTTGTFITHLTNAVGCDSAVTLNLTVKAKSTKILSTNICPSQLPYIWFGKTFTLSHLSDTLSRINYLGCDSVVMLNLIVKPNSTNSITTSICQGSSYLVDSFAYTTTGTFVTHLTNYLGCDSAVILNLNVKPNSTNSITTSICQGSSYLVDSFAYNTTGTFVTHLNNYVGCDSVVTLNLSVNQNSTFNITASICNGNSYSIGGSTFYTQGIDTIHLSNYLGCDSSIYLNLKVYPPLTAGICQGNSYNFNNQMLVNSGTYFDTLINYLGGDSIITLNLIVNTPSSSIINIPALCQGDHFSYNSIVYYPSASGTYYFHYLNYHGCDSIVSVNFVVNPIPIAQSIVGNPSITPFQSYTYLVNNTVGYTYNWVIQGGAIQTGQGTNSVSVMWSANGPYLLQLIQTTSTGCSDTLSLSAINSNCSLTYNVFQLNNTPVCQNDTVKLVVQINTPSTFQWLKNGNLISGGINDTLLVTQSGNYQVQITSGTCTVISNVNSIYFNSSPIVPVINSSGINGGCGFQNDTLSSINSYNTYQWNTGATSSTIVVNQSGVYTLTGYGSNGCHSTSAPFAVNLSILPQYQICIASVDSASGKNIVIWEKPSKVGIDSFYIFKESNQLNIFNKIGVVGVNAFSTYIDQNSNPQQQSDKYAIGVKDTCGNLGLQSVSHKTIHLTINQGLGNVWNLIWNSYEGLSIGSYNIYRQTNSSTQLLNTISASSTSYTDVNPPSGVLNYLVEAVNPTGCSPSARLKSNNYSSSMSNTVMVNNNTGITAIDNLNFSIYPNPTNDNLNIVFADAKIRTIKVFDVTGRLLKSEKIAEKHNTLYLDNSMSAGIYKIGVIEENKAPVFVKIIKTQ